MPPIHVNGARLAVDESGSGPPLVLLHGLGANAGELWQRPLDALAANFRVVTYDLRGSGRSEVTPGPYTIEGLADDLAALIAELGLERPLVMGHSMGGSVALLHAARDPAGVRAVVGLGAPATFPQANRDGLEARAETVERDGMDAVAETVAGNALAPSFRERDPDGYACFVLMLQGNNAAGYAAQCRALVGLDITGELPRIEAPVLLLTGDRDGVAPEAATRASAEAIPGARYQVVEDTAHILPFERADVLEAVALPFLLEHA